MPACDCFQPGMMIHKVDIESATRSLDAHGAPQITGWSVDATRRCMVETLTGQERLEAAIVASEATLKITCGKVTCAGANRLTVTRADTGGTFTAQVVWVDNVNFQGRKTIIYAKQLT